MTEYQRSIDLGDKLNKFLYELTGKDEDYFSKLTPTQLIQLKAALANINNVLTLKTTIAFANWLSDALHLNSSEREKMISKVEKTKPNTNGYDIELPELNLIAEIKSIAPINDGNYYGAAQRNSILDDAQKLINGKKRVSETKSLIKFIGLLDLGERTDQAISKLMVPTKNIRTTQAIRIKRHEIVELLEIAPDNFKLTDLSPDKIYLKKVSI